MEWKITTNINQIDPKEIAKIGVDEALSKINAKFIKTGN